MSLADRLAAARRDRVDATELEPVGTDALDHQARASRHLDPFSHVKQVVHQQLLETLGPKLYDARMTQTDLEAKVRAALQEVLAQEETPLTTADRTRIAQEVSDDILGYGPIEPFLRDPDITEIMVNGYDDIWIEREGKIFKVDGGFTNESHLRRTIDKIVGRVGRRVDEASPMVDARLPDGSRVNAVIPPLALDGSPADHPQVQRRPLHLRRPDQLRQPQPGDGRVPLRLRQGPPQHPGLRRHRRRQDHHPERPLLLHPGGRADHHHRGLRRAPAAPGARPAPRVAPAQHRGPRRGQDPRPGPQLAAHAARPHRRR